MRRPGAGNRLVSTELMAPTLQVAHSPRGGRANSGSGQGRGETPEAAQQGRQLREAAEAADVELLQQLLEEGADVNLANWYGRSALMAAAQSGDAQSVSAFETIGSWLAAASRGVEELGPAVAVLPPALVAVDGCAQCAAAAPSHCEPSHAS